ncbi:MAG: DNA cytosine methyltransferase [Desulfomonile sp.]|nr:DNA cytosine methyltransferase [Desulfomonile sp.]
MSHNQTPKYQVISLFTGAGGLDIGLEQTGRFVTVACVEKEKVFCDTLRLNRDKGRIGAGRMAVYESDLSLLDPNRLLDDLGLISGEVDVIAGGPPCQAFSTAGKRNTLLDPRGTMLWRFLDFLATLRPKVFVIENVRGLASAALRHRRIKDRPENGGPPLSAEEQPGSVLRQFIDDLRTKCENYRMDAFLVNAVNYGAPQLRERLIIIGNRLSRKARFPLPTHGPSNGAAVQGGLFDENGNGGLKPFKTLGDVLRGRQEDCSVLMDFSDRKKRYLAMVKPGSNWRSLPEQVQRESLGKAFFAKGGRSGWWRKLSFDLPCPTLVTMPNHASTSLCHPTKLRALTLKEYALIQEFPDDWEFCGTPLEQYTQAGNAVPVALARVVGTTILDILDQAAAKEADLPDFSYEYIRAHVRTRKWYKSGNVYVWDEDKSNPTAEYGPMKTERAFLQV